MDRGRARWAFVPLALGSMVLGGVAAARGELELYLFLIFPVIRAEGAWGAASLLLAVGAFVSLLLTVFSGATSDRRNVRPSAGGVLIIGPLPIVLGTDRRATILALVVAVTVLALLLFLLL